MILSLELSHSETGIVAQCPWLCDIQTWLSGPPKDSILMQARTEQYPKAKKKTGNPKESQKTDYISKMENIILNLHMQHLISFAPNSREP